MIATVLAALGFVARGNQARFWVVLPLLLLAGLLEGFGAAALLPILNLIEAGPGALPARLVVAFDLVGIRPTLAGLVGLLFGAMVLRAAAVFAARVGAVRAGLDYEAGVKTDLLGDLLRASWPVAQRTTSGAFTNAALVETVRVKEIFLYTADFLAAALAAVVFAAVAALLSPLGFVAAAVVGGVTVGIYAGLNRRVRRLGRALTAANDAAQRALAEVLGGVRYLLATHSGGALRARFAGQVRAAAAAQGRFHVLHTLARVTNEPLALAALIATAAFLHASGQGLSAIIVFLAVLFRLYTKLVYALMVQQQLAHLLPAAAAVEGLRAELRAAREPNGTRPFARLAQGIRLAGVDFAHPGRPPLFRGLDLEIPAGRTVALVGESGAGKSTIVDLVTGLVEPQAGAVLIDGVPLGAFDRASYRARLALVPQEPILFNDSIAANIRLQRPEADDAAVERAAAMAFAHEFIATLPQGYATVVGERGVMLSGGQKQRIALARSLLAEPDLLILDEATSALDHESEARIKAAIDSLKGRLTVLIIAHRLSTIEKADAVYSIEGGRARRVEAPGAAARTA